MKKNLCFLLIVICTLSLKAQQKPLDFSLGEKRLAKISDQTPASNTVEKILIQNNNIWLGTGKGLSKSTDNGNSWTNYYNSKDFGTESISSLGFDNDIIWASTWHYENKLGSDVPVGTSLRYSNDQGQTWKTINQPVDNPGDSSIVYGVNKIRALPVTVPEQNFIYDIAFTKNTIWIVAFAGGLRKSTDMGKTWQRVVLPPDNLDSIKPTDVLNFSLQPVAGAFGKEAHLNHRAFSVLTVDDNTIYVGTAGGINKSTDGGVSWTKFNHANQSKPITGNFVLALDINRSDNSIWAATWKAEAQNENWGVSVTRDGGQTWDNFLAGEHAMDFGFKDLGNSNSENFVATQNGVYRTSNNGSTWITAPEIKDDVTGIGISTKQFRAVEINKLSDNSTDIWLGSLNGLARLNETTGFWSGKWKVFLASEKLVSATESYAFPNPFTPGKEQVKIKYSTSQSASVTVRILDFGMNLVRTVIQNATRNGASDHLELWDGKDESGRTVPNGVYFYRIDIDGSKPLFGKIMVLM